MDQEIWRVLVGIQEVLSFATLPSVIYQPELNFCKDDCSWRAYYGDGRFFGSGKSPAEAMRDFDRKWYERLS